ncbi:metal ABC transporter substrate-binding protein [Tomitella gaofuii]|uniref:metal ABC transporter substrate-binding protein n=1 Tax=Tomitella gaofuii TaxID=2760083 RepID=UPI0015F9FF85|nr:metal ABC transporter substrate-binding protein [Tomitella gaofuii]
MTALRSVVAVAAVALLAGCAPGAGGRDDDRPVVLTTFTVLADIARQVAGDHLHVESITKPGAEIHGYQPTPGDVRKAARADLIVDNGLDLELWFDKFLADADAPHVVASAGVEPIAIAGDAYAGRPNPHAWMSPANVQAYAATLADAFAELDPAHADDFQANAQAYQRQLQQIHDDLTRRLAAVPEDQRVLVTCEGAFSYLARDAGLTERYLWPVNAENQATPQQVAAVVDYVRDNDVPAVFCESTVSDKPMRQVTEATGAEFGGTLYVDSLSTLDGPVPTYLDLIRYDTDTIADALTGERR